MASALSHRSLLRRAPALWRVCCVHPLSLTLKGHANRSSVALAMRPGAAGVGTFPEWLSLAVAPASKGLIPQPVSMSGTESRDERRQASRTHSQISLATARGAMVTY